MDPGSLGLSRKAAGADYLASVERLGLRPTALFWAFDKSVGHFVLVLTTPMFDYAGPLELSKVLIEAYRKSATPKEIDPFIIRMHSPEHTIIRDIAKVVPFHISLTDAAGREVTGFEAPDVMVKTADLEITAKWVYRFEAPAALKTVEASRKWRRFVANVDRLAA